MPHHNCSKYFSYEDFYYCSKTWQRTKPTNTPKQAETISAIRELATTILDPIIDTFGEIKLTYGFCSHTLAAQIKKNETPLIAPNLDQHAGYELNSRGKRICERGGFACDFIIHNSDMKFISKWIIENCDFDRLYFYGENRPIHVSIGPECKRQIVIMRQLSDGRYIPRVVSEDNF
ncbi:MULTISPECIES: hypothetical protein [unclassified Oleiphilus]|uniref:hypothetical protein n=1 Tax=unclassified Oleiphilus TaxID=2631174 RepID=UPI0007C3637A|nr:MULTISPECIES: hypothetical protein [unclassified Oleiphilus]KZZ34607.1 hypothetical protein A3757_17380 [Oleiphilus sp. HI0117]KZZ56571.1 hypothetical protein A3761_08400 [Oleiphilus sp. HI0123]